MAYEEFSGELDKPTQFEEFSGALDKPQEERGIIQRIKDVIAPEYKSVLETQPAAPSQPLIERRGAPVSEEKFTELKNKYDAATPQERATLSGSKGVSGSVFKTIDEQYKQADKTVAQAPTLGVFDTRKEARANAYIGRGLNAESANSKAAVDAEMGINPTQFGSLTSFEDDKNYFQKLADKTIQKPLDKSVGGSALETAGDVVRGIASGYTSIPAAGWDALYMASEQAGGMGNFSAMAKESAKAGRKSVANWENAADPNSITKAVFESTTQMLLSAGLTGGVGNASIALSSGISAANSYGEARQAGKSHGDASERAAINFVAEFLGEKVALPQVQSVLGKFAGGGTAKQFASAIGELAGKDLLGEEFTTTVEDLYDKLGSGGLRPGMTMKDYIEDVVQTAKVTIGQTALIGGAGAIARKYQEQIPAYDATAGVSIPAAPEVSLAEQRVKERGFLTPERAAPAQLTNFTPADSPTKTAGLVDVVVPLPSAPVELPPINPSTEQQFGLDKLRMGTTDVGTAGALGATNVAGGTGGGTQLGGGVGTTGLGAPAAGGLPQPRGAQDLAASIGQAPFTGGANGQQAAAVETWPGRKGDGYVTEADAKQAIGGRQRMFPDLTWSVEQMPNGRYRLAGYPSTQQETTLGTQTTQAQQAKAQGQQAPAATPAVTPETVAGEKLNKEWTAFAPETGTKGIPRAEMPQIKSETRGAMVNFLNARGITSTQEEVPADSLKPTQAEFSQKKVASALEYAYGDRSILVSSDNHVLDGHHQWLAKLQSGEPVKVIRLNAPIDELINVVREFPSATVAAGATNTGLAQGQVTPVAGAEGQGVAGAPQLGAGQEGFIPAQWHPNKLQVPGSALPIITSGIAGQTEKPTLELKPVKGTPISVIKLAQNDIMRNEGVSTETVKNSDLSEQQKATIQIAHLYGNTVTYLNQVSGPSGVMPNGLIVHRSHIVLDSKSEDGALFAGMHEVTHGLPDHIRQPLLKALRALFKPGMEGQLKAEFKYNDKELDEEIPALMAQAISKRPQFWQDLRQEMGNKDFAALANVILDRLSKWVKGIKEAYGQGFLDKYVSDVPAAQKLLVEAHAQAMREMGTTQESGEIQRAKRGTTQVGEYDVRTMKDGSIVVYGDGEQIRAAMPEGTVGRVTKDGVVFTNAAAPRVRAALEGRNIAYSRGGQVTEKLPMKDGKYLGAPEKFNTPAKIPTLRKWLRQLADEGAPGRYWYENSGKEVLKMVGGDVVEARKFVALLAIYSPQAKVDANSTFALRAWAQHNIGQPINVKTGVMDSKAKNALEHVDEFWSGEKTGNFFFNLLREIDPTTEGKQGATIDMWMMRAGQYSNDAPTATQYSFMENETNRLAAELGWEPQQVQAAIWVAMKARMENSGVKKATEASSEKKGFIRFVPGKDGKGKVRDIIKGKEKDHRDNWLKHAFAHDPSKSDTEQAKFDFGDGLKRHVGQVSFEARPGRSTGVLPGIHNATYAQQVEFQQDVQKAFYDKDGNDMLAMKLGLLVDTTDILSPGVWQGEVSPSSQKLVAMAPAKGIEGQTHVDPAQAKALNLYASVAGLVAKQEGVGWHRSFYAGSKRNSNGLDIDIGRVIKPDEAKALGKAIGDWMDANEKSGWQDQFAIISSASGVRLVNFGIITNEILQKDISKVAESVLPDGDVRVFASDGDMPTNNWKENPNGETYVQGISAAGRSDVLDWARTVLAPRVQRVFDEYSKKYDWGDAGSIQFSRRSTGLAESAGGPSIGRDQGDAVKVVGAVHYGKQSGLSYLSGTSSGTGIRGAEQERLSAPGVDPRIKRRVYFYLPVAGGIPMPEIGLGGSVYTANLSNLYDPSAGSRKLPSDPNAFESAVLDAGFRGYINREQGTAVVLNSDVPVKFAGSKTEQQMVPRKIERIVPKNETREEGKELVRKPTDREMLDIVKARPTLAKEAPSFKLEYGQARVAKDQADAADRVLSDVGSSFQFNVMRSNRQTETPEFKRWFGDSKVVDADGKPLVVYHATPNDISSFDTRNGSHFGTVDQSEEIHDRHDFNGVSSGLNTIAAYLSIKNPKRIDDLGPNPAAWRKAKELAESEGFDGLVYSNEFEGGEAQDSYVVFSPTQIKSAIGNNGEFNPENPSIVRSKRTKVDNEVASLFGELHNARGLAKVRAKAKVAEHELADNIMKVEDQFYDILQKLDDDGLIKINCK